MRILLLGLFFGIAGWGAAQPTIQWQKTFGGSDSDQARSIQQTLDGGFIVAGQTVSNDGDVFGNHGGIDFWLLKLGQTGAIQWKKTFGGNDNERPYAIQQTSDRGYVIAGHTLSNNGDVSGNHGGYDAWVLKLDSMGVIQWQKCLGGSGWEEAWDVQQTNDGGFVIAGRSESVDGDLTLNHGFLDYWVVKLTSAGEIQWQKSLGGSGLDICYAISLTNDGGYVVAGESSSTDGDVTGNHGGPDYWIVKLNFEGKIEWEKSLGGSSIDDARDIQLTRDGGYIVLGQSYSNNGDITGHHGGYDLWVVKLSVNGEIEWQSALGGSAEDNAGAIQQVKDDGFIVTGTTQSTNGDVVGNDGGADLWVIKLSNEGSIEWQKTLGGTQQEVGYDVKQTSDEGFIISGFAWSNNGDVIGGSAGKSDYWIVKLAPPSTPTTQPTPHPLNLYPNPATQSITIQIPDIESSLNIQITDLLGRELGRQTIPNGGTVDIESLPNGVYLVSASTDSGEVFLGRVCKQE